KETEIELHQKGLRVVLVEAGLLSMIDILLEAKQSIQYPQPHFQPEVAEEQ
ncbi:35245_t:CDS:1, partial [Racocetra persica]